MENNEFKKRFAAARRKLISNDFSGLNEMQRAAVMATEGPLLLLAGAGSGKTTVLIDRIVNLIRYGRASDTDEVPDFVREDDLHLLEEYAAAPEREPPADVRALCAVEPVEPWRIIAITFTNKAAGELKSRLNRSLGSGANDVWAMTFHSACVRILRRSIGVMGIPETFTIYDSGDSMSVIKRVLSELNMDDKLFPPRTVLGSISRAKDNMLSASDYASQADNDPNPRKKQIAKAYLEYSRRLRAAGALDFDDLIFYTVRLLLDYPEVRERYQRQFKYVLVDEYQDTSHMQYMLASLLAGGRENICVVGDDDQSIYRFRGATIENILSFEDRYKNARVIKLEQNYRSTGHILGAANSVIDNNLGRKGKNLWTSAGDGDRLRLYVADNDDDEAAYIADQVISGAASGMRWSDFAVLYRMNAQSNRLEYAFKRRGIPYRVIGGTRFFDRSEIKDMTSYLSVIHNPSDDLRLVRIINNPPRGIGAATVEKLGAIAAESHRPMLDVAADAESFPSLRAAAPKLLSFLNLIMELRQLSNTMPLDEFYDALLEKTGYIASLGNSDEALARVENIHELKSNIVSYMEGAEEPSLAGFLYETALYTDLDSLDPSADSVKMMTIHSAKGLEFPWVFVVGMEDGIFPSFRAIGEQDEMEEERRLCYVALTRAKKELFLTAARHRMLFGRTSSNSISRFVDEIPSEHIDRPKSERPDGLYVRLHSGSYDGSYGGRSGQPEYGGRPNRRSASEYGEKPNRSQPHEYGARPNRRSEPKRPAAVSALPSLAVGDRIEHRAFGYGTVAAYTTMANDALITVDFDTVGRKRLMLKAASAFIKKV